jgi:eukaryotic-like serine/threonine-protein kinase
VKPDNIIMGIPPRLIDLSIARTLERAGRTRGPTGADAYMAPSRHGDGVPVGPRRGVGLGVTLFETLVGQRPFSKGDRDSKAPAAVGRMFRCQKRPA